jgi:hypothetical protein
MQIVKNHDDVRWLFAVMWKSHTVASIQFFNSHFFLLVVPILVFGEAINETIYYSDKSLTQKVSFLKLTC